MIDDQRRPGNIPAGDTFRPGVGRSRLTGIPRRSRTARTPTDLREISWRLQPRDYVLAHLLDEHRFLSTEQIAAVLFTSVRTCRNRLDVLRTLGFITWFMPVHGTRGRLPVHWVPGPLSARYVALYNGERAPTTRAVRELQDTHASTTSAGHIGHDDGANQFFVDLLAHSRRHPESRLTRWWSSARIARVIDRNTRPDGHGVWREGDRQVAFFLEHDTGTEHHPDRAAKLVSYQTVRDAGGPAWPVLFWLASTAQETHLHQHLAGATRGLVVATAARDRPAGHGPAGPMWQVVGGGGCRLRLAELPDRLTAGGAYHPGPPGPDEDPLYLLRDDQPEPTQP
jgi:protein involved in plasmid replication-relaxation